MPQQIQSSRRISVTWNVPKLFDRHGQPALVKLSLHHVHEWAWASVGSATFHQFKPVQSKAWWTHLRSLQTVTEGYISSGGSISLMRTEVLWSSYCSYGCKEGGTTCLVLLLFPLDFGKTITLTGTPCVQSLDFKHVSDQSVSPVEWEDTWQQSQM